MNTDSILKNLKGRVVGFDCHPDSFTAALLSGRTPAEAVTEKTFTQVPNSQLLSWAKKNTTPEDCIALEASGNSFSTVRQLQSIGRTAVVLESCHLGKLKIAHANNDKISAVRIGKAFLAGTAKRVWVPDTLTQERRDCFHMHRKSVKRVTQTNNRIISYLSDNGVRLNQSVAEMEMSKAMETIRSERSWSERQLQLIEAMLAELNQAQTARRQWESLMAAEVAADPVLLSLTRLCGVRDIVAFAIGAVIGDIQRFESAKKLVSYVGLNPAFDDSGETNWSGGIGGHGHKLLRSLLIESAQSILRCGRNNLAKWGKKLLARKGSINIAAAAVARKLVVDIWYLLKGKWDELVEIDPPLSLKIGKVLSKIGKERMKAMGKSRKVMREEIVQKLKTGRVYILKMDRKAEGHPNHGIQGSPPQEPSTIASEYGLA